MTRWLVQHLSRLGSTHTVVIVELLLPGAAHILLWSGTYTIEQAHPLRDVGTGASLSWERVSWTCHGRTSCITHQGTCPCAFWREAVLYRPFLQHFNTDAVTLPMGVPLGFLLIQSQLLWGQTDLRSPATPSPVNCMTTIKPLLIKQELRPFQIYPPFLMTICLVVFVWCSSKQKLSFIFIT